MACLFVRPRVISFSLDTHIPTINPRRIPSSRMISSRITDRHEEQVLRGQSRADQLISRRHESGKTSGETRGSAGRDWPR